MPLKEAYLDNSATTRVYPEVAAEMQAVMEKNYGNASALHSRGSAAERILHASRRTIAEILGVKSEEIIFTSGGTEANNLALLGMARRNARRGNHLITTAIEHASVLGPLKKLEEEGFSVSYLLPDEQGRIDPRKVAAALTPQTILVSVMHVNNEIGSVQPLSQIAAAVKAKNPAVLIHVDAVQSFCKLPLNPVEQGIDALSLSAHKIHGPKGTGALYLRQGTLLQPLFFGGEHEKGLRPGTENTPGIAGMALAARLSAQNRKEKGAHLQNLKEKLVSAIQTAHPRAVLNGPRKEEGAPHIFNLSFPGLKGEIVLHALEQKNIYVSTGAACHAHSKSPSHVLQALQLKQNVLEGALRFSLSYLNTAAEIDYAATQINEVVHTLENFMPNFNNF
ncbi:MAG: cysteine desulfurase family protein [Dethiobacteria bacterium]|jgi:cysteine desulfurase